YSLPWNAAVRERTLVVSLPATYRVLSWAPLAGGLMEAQTLLNHQVQTDECPADEPNVYLQALARRLQLTSPVVGLMTGVKVERLVRGLGQQARVRVECFATVGLTNALAVGDPAIYDESPGTINLILVVDHPLTAAALVEAVAIVTEAKVRALYNAVVRSTVSD